MRNYKIFLQKAITDVKSGNHLHKNNGQIMLHNTVFKQYN